MRIPHWRAEDRARFLPLLLESFCILLIYAVVAKVHWRVTFLPEAAYTSSFVSWEALKDFRVLVGLIVPSVPLIIGWRRIRWSQLEGVPQLRWFIVAVSLASAWTFSSYDFNLYLNEAHYGDRLLLLALALGTIWHPAFAFYYVVFGSVLVHQFHYPLPGFNWLDKQILFNALLLFSGMLFMGLVRRQRSVVYVGLVASFAAANYLIPGIAKLQTSWAIQDNLGNLALMTHMNGWLGTLSIDSFVQVVNQWGWVNKPLIVMTLITELGVAALFIHRKVFVALVLATVGLHVGIFVSSGICFWKWVLFNLALVWPVFRLRPSEHLVLFNWRFVVISLLVILSSPWHSRPSWLAWFDTAYDEFYEIQAIGVSGTEYNVERGFFAPHDLLFAQNRFWYLSEKPILVGTFGATSNAELDAAIRDADSVLEIEALVAESGTLRYDREKIEIFSRYQRVFWSTLNERGSKKTFLSHIAAPHHIWSQREEPRYALQEPVVEVIIRFHRVWFDGDVVHSLEDSELRRIDIPPSREAALAALAR